MTPIGNLKTIEVPGGNRFLGEGTWLHLGTTVMSEHADIVRANSYHFTRDEKLAALAALDALVAERDGYRAALEEIASVATDLPHARRLDRDRMREIAREALALAPPLVTAD